MWMHKSENRVTEGSSYIISKVNFQFLCWNSSEQIEKFVLQGCMMDWTVAGMLEDGCSCASLVALCAAPQSIKGRATPSPFVPRQTHICMTGKCMTLYR